MSKIKRIPIAPSVEKDDVVRAVYFMNLDVNNFIEGDESRPTETIYNVRGKSTFLHYLDDEVLGFPYIAVSGENTEDLEARIREKVETITPADLARDFASPPKDPDAFKRLLGHAFLLAPATFDKTFDEYFRTGFNHSDPGVRRQAVVGVGYVGWPELAKPLRALAENDSDASVRRDAKAMLDALLDESGGKE